MKTIIRILVLTCIIFTLLSTVRFITISYFHHKFQNKEIITNMSNEIVTDYYWTFDHYSSEDYLSDFLIILISVIFTGNLIVLLKQKLKNIDNFKTDFLLFKPQWLANTSLGERRLISIVLNILILIGIGLLSISPAMYIFDFPGIFEYHASSAIVVFLSLTIGSFWCLIGILGLIHWILDGFNKK